MPGIEAANRSFCGSGRGRIRAPGSDRKEEQLCGKHQRFIGIRRKSAERTKWKIYRKCKMCLQNMTFSAMIPMLWIFLSDPMNVKEVESWLNVLFVRKLLTLVMESAIPIEGPTESGTPT